MRSVDGPAQAGDYVAIIVMGAAQVKVQDGETILAGQRLAAGVDGSVRPLQTRTLDGMVVTDGVPVIGVALEPATKSWSEAEWSGAAASGVAARAVRTTTNTSTDSFDFIGASFPKGFDQTVSTYVKRTASMVCVQRRYEQFRKRKLLNEASPRYNTSNSQDAPLGDVSPGRDLRILLSSP